MLVPTHVSTAPTRVLFVDDDPLVRRALRRTLDKPGDPVLRCEFVADGFSALRHLEREPVDIVVSDMMMPEMDGFELLEAVQARHPDTVRMVLTGETDPKTIFRSVPVAHQFLSKPWQPDHLRAELERGRRLRRLLANPTLRALVSRGNELPAAPQMYMQLIGLLSDPHVSLGRVADIIEADVGMSAKIVHLAGCAFFGLPTSVRTARGAVMYLGADTIKVLVLGFEVFSAFSLQRAQAFDMNAFQRHSILTAQLARALMGRADPAAGEAMLAGMLHDVGRLLLAARAPDTLSEIAALAEAERLTPYQAELEVLGASHCDIGSYLMGLWGLPHAVIDGILHHHAPRGSNEESFGPVAAVYLANALAHEREGPPSSDPPPEPSEPLDLAYLHGLGVDAARLAELRATAAELRGRDEPPLRSRRAARPTAGRGRWPSARTAAG